MRTSECHQVPSHPFRQHGGLHNLVEWGHGLKNTTQSIHHFGQLSVIVAKGAEYGKVNTTYHY
jgi:hypothetical protein